MLNTPFEVPHIKERKGTNTGPFVDWAIEKIYFKSTWQKWFDESEKKKKNIKQNCKDTSNSH